MMIKTLYRITMCTGDVINIWAFTSEEAKILAQAQNINEGKDYSVNEVVREYD